MIRLNHSKATQQTVLFCFVQVCKDSVLGKVGRDQSILEIRASIAARKSSSAEQGRL